MGAWIEISEYQITDRLDKVAPLVGAWIEIYRCLHLYGVVLSLPLWERGLKYENLHTENFDNCRSPCGSVD